MDPIYLILIAILFLLAISDLIVGVSNDAVNFLNSAVGSKAAPIKTLMLVAATGILAGTVFSGGMMEIARSGVFYPEKFTFAHIMLIFIAVMIADVILLDAFNTIGFPTSTTVSLIFELLGASVAIALFNISSGPVAGSLGDYINSGKALTVVSGILVSILIAFIAGAVIQYIVRLIFTFNYEKKLKYLGGFFGGIAITIIVYFILIKGAKDAAFMTPQNYHWIKSNSLQLIILCFTGTSALLYLLNLLFKINILKIIVLVGTFALAMAFAGNDLVNFIGVPLAGYDSYINFANTPGADSTSFTMESLNGPVKTPLVFLLISGLIMVITLYKSRKARTVIMTEVNLSRQDEGDEKFGSTALSRGIVSISIGINRIFSGLIPEEFKNKISKRFVPQSHDRRDKDKPAFDLLRAAVNLVVSSALIALGTSLKLPLSTTYVTFMVAMSTSFSDGAWDRESAVYRITGVFSVIGGWFFTAISAFALAFILASIFIYGGTGAVFVMVLVAAVMAYRTHKIHLRKEEAGKVLKSEEEVTNAENMGELLIQNSRDVLLKVSQSLNKIINESENSAIAELRGVRKEITLMQIRAKNHRKVISRLLKGIAEHQTEKAYNTIRVQDNILQIINCTDIIACSTYNHLANYHKPLNDQQYNDLRTIAANLTLLIDLIIKILGQKDEKSLLELENIKEIIELSVDKASQNEVKRIREEKTGNRSSILFMSILQEVRNIIHFSSQVVKHLPEAVQEKQTINNANL
jgi:phosphate/sulfate permease